jgi:hypothetical protein
MTLRIERAEREGATVFVLSGRFVADHIEELQGLLQRETDAAAIVFDLRELRLADRGAIKFLAHCELGGMQLVNCTGYIREWIAREKG